MAPIEITILIALIFLAIFHVYMAAFTSWHLSKSAYFELGQKYAQYAIVWLIPILGVAFVLHVLSPEIRRRRPGWFPWFDFLLVSAFASSATASIEDAAAGTGNTDNSPTPAGCGDD